MMSRFFGSLAMAGAIASQSATACNNIWWNPGDAPIKPIYTEDERALSTPPKGRQKLEIQRNPETGAPTAYRFGAGEFKSLPIDFYIWRADKSNEARKAKPLGIEPTSGCGDDWYVNIGSLGSYDFYSTLNHNFLFEVFTQQQRTAREIFEEWFRRQKTAKQLSIHAWHQQATIEVPG
jgi:hypothetical protein